nr:NAD(P)-binding protein [Neobacillus sp. Marseille-Q6967]
MKSYPIMLQLEGKKVVVIGGGKVAARKVSGLMGTGADITVISPEVTDELRELDCDRKISWKEKIFSKEDLDGAFMIFAATNDKDLNHYIRGQAADHQLVILADDPAGSDFHVPSHFRRGRLSIAVSTGGASPILASQIRKRLEKEYDESYEDYVEFLFLARQRILAEVHDITLKRKLLTLIASPEFLNNKNRETEFTRLIEEVSTN